jgi:uncharacterized DUF497 family protein
MITIKEPISFQWDEANSDKNWKKHGVTRLETEEAFFDPHRRIAKDLLHSQAEERYIIIGRTNSQRRLFLVFTIRAGQVRVISARDLNKRKEGNLYEKAA